MNKVILYVGNFKKSWCTEVHIKQSFETLGYTVIPVQEDSIDTLLLALAIEEHRPGFLLYTKTWNNAIDWKLIKRKVFTVSWTLDLYHDIGRKTELDNNPFFHTHLVLSPDGGHDKEFKAHKINHRYLKPGVFDKECYLGKQIEEYTYDVIFVGSYLQYHQEWTHRKDLIDYLRWTYRNRFDFFPKQIPIRGDELNNLYASAKIVIGDSLYSPHYWSDRVYETIGRGGFMIHPKIEGLEEEFEYGKHLIGYNYYDFEGLKKKIDYYLKHTDEREEIRLAGHNMVKEKCTYVVRCKEALAIINEEIKLWKR